MKRITATALTIMALGVILVFSSCATLDSFLKPELNTLTLHFADGDVITYVLPPEFPELNEDQIEYIPIYYGYAIVARQVIDGNIYGLILAGPDAEIIGAGMFIGEAQTWWVYENGKPIDKSNDHAALDAHVEQYITDLMQNPKKEM